MCRSPPLRSKCGLHPWSWRGALTVSVSWAAGVSIAVNVRGSNAAASDQQRHKIIATVARSRISRCDTVSCSRHIRSLYGPAAVGRRTGRWKLGVSTKDEEWLSCLRFAGCVTSPRWHFSPRRSPHLSPRHQHDLIVTAQSGALTCITPRIMRAGIIMLATSRAARASTAAPLSCRRKAS